eukprot:CAMPEP_0194058976 /NCGR_PEP_ID=MMETSP0009_2-20130614/67779_1 /TAXON_ID=210454 /ORGANISM="Grammatophora oceanica, Strain CCMP 410" /LENGTH=102 /DNA_ID=CAMNT_0038709321 /DNA_START=5 /DNA_END=310 /DNA_ORIENTATION=+
MAASPTLERKIRQYATYLSTTSNGGNDNQEAVGMSRMLLQLDDTIQQPRAPPLITITRTTTAATNAAAAGTASFLGGSNDNDDNEHSSAKSILKGLHTAKES